uniref:DEAD/DEAH box helicase n=1 Tax=Adlercreutzia sp. ZJ242 TaxID=2709409 RepID=UPI00198199AD
GASASASGAASAPAGGPDAPFPALAPLRDEVLEGRAVRLVQAFFDADNTLPLADDRAAGALLFGGLAQFRALGEVFTTPAFDRLLSDKKPRVSMGLSIAGNLINLDVSATDLDAGELAALLASYRRRKRFHRLRSGAFLDMRDHDLSELERLVDDLGISAAELAGGHVELPTYRAFYLDREFSEARRDASFESYVERFHRIDQAAYAVPDALARTLRPYQREGFRWMSALADLGFGGILADEMGLGKSVQLISFLLARATEARAAGPSLIVCPASLVYNWLAEFAAFAPDLSVRAVEGPRRERAAIRAERGVDVLVTSYDLARIDVRELEQADLFCCVLDEAQYIKNHATLTTRAVKRLRARHRFALTGTPVENRLSEIWSIFDFLMPGFLGSYARFRERFELGILGGDEDLARRLQSLVGPFVLRRRKDQVLPDLPDKLETVVYVPLEREQRRLYDAAEQQLRQELNVQKKATQARGGGPVPEKSRVEVLAELMRLRQIALDPALLFENYRGGAAKMPAIVDLVEQSRDAGAKALVFSQFTSYLELIAAELEAREVPYFRITGATPKKRRVELVDAFNADDTPAFLISLKAGGTGLNLTGASVVIHADPWWNAAATDQATDRAHRIGQENVVSVYKVIAKGTVEERILALQQAKVELAESVIGGAASSASGLAGLTREELLDLLQG